MSAASTIPTEYRLGIYVAGIMALQKQVDSFNYDLRNGEFSPLCAALKHTILQRPENRRKCPITL